MTRLMPSALVLAALLAAGTAQAAPIYATSVLSYTPGTKTKMLPGRADPSAALGAPDDSFVSLGRGGSIVLGFGGPISPVGKVFEITFNDKSKHPESAKIYAGDGKTWTLIASITNYLSTSFSADGIFSYLKIVDTTKRGPSFDGFDIDAVAVSPVPVPASGLLLGGLLGLGALRRRRKG